MKQLGEPADEVVAHPIRAGREQLDDEQLAIAIDDNARKPVAFAIDQPITVAALADDELSQRERVF